MTRPCTLAVAQMGKSAACVPARHSRPRPARERGSASVLRPERGSSPARRFRQQCRTQERSHHKARERTHARSRTYTHRACTRHRQRRLVSVHVGLLDLRLGPRTLERRQCGGTSVAAEAVRRKHAMVGGVGRQRVDVLRRTEGARGHGVEGQSRGRPPAGRWLGRPRARTRRDIETTIALTSSAARLLCSLARPRPHAPVHPTRSAAILNGGTPAPWLIAASGARGQCAEFRHGRPQEPTPPLAAGALSALVRKSRL